MLEFDSVVWFYWFFENQFITNGIFVAREWGIEEISWEYFRRNLATKVVKSSALSWNLNFA